jgi:hypothetical protein
VADRCHRSLDSACPRYYNQFQTITAFAVIGPWYSLQFRWGERLSRRSLAKADPRACAAEAVSLPRRGKPAALARQSKAAAARQ